MSILRHVSLLLGLAVAFFCSVIGYWWWSVALAFALGRWWRRR